MTKTKVTDLQYQTYTIPHKMPNDIPERLPFDVATSDYISTIAYIAVRGEVSREELIQNVIARNYPKLNPTESAKDWEKCR